MEFLEKRRKFFAAKRAEEKRNRPPTRAQQRSIMCTYLKNMDGWKPKNLKNKSLSKIQVLFDKAMKRVNTFVDMDTEVVGSSKKAEAEIAQESSSKRARDELEQENAKKQVENDNDFAELKRCLEIVPGNEDNVTIDATPLSSKSPTIVDYKIYKEVRKSYFQIIRADDHPQMYLTFSKMLKNFNREDLENTTYYLFVEKMYPLTNHTLTQMWNDVRLQVDYEVKLAYDLIRLVRRQLREGYVPE
nr:hypothetical protein [Tanacetum cinerariifolium]